MLIDDYFEYQIKFEKKYGKKSIVLMQVGSFFEFYGVNNDQEKIGDPQIITELLNIQLTRRNKQILENSRSNCLMAGFPTHALKRFINILLSNSYTVILIEQVTEPPNPKRDITQIFSPGTYIEEINKSDPNYIVSVYIIEEKFYKNGNIIFSFGISSIDLSTGENYTYEGTTIYYEKNAFLEEIYRFIESFNPKEIIINIELDQCKNINLEDIRNKLNQGDRVIHYEFNIEPKYKNINYQNTLLKKIFPKHGLYSPVEYIDMEKKQYALISYIILLQFSYEHNEKIIEKIKLPNQWEYNDHLILYNNAIHQLNIVPLNNSNSSSRSLFDIIQKTSTSMGKRLLKFRIMNPITDIIELNKRYEYIDQFIKLDRQEKKQENNQNKSFLDTIEKTLNEIIDIERMHRKLSLQILHPYEFLNLSYSYDNIDTLINIIKTNFDITQYNLNNDLLLQFYKFRDEYNLIFDLQEIGKYGLLNISNSFFKKYNYKDIDLVQDEIDIINQKFNDECKYLSNLIELNSDFVKIDSNDREGYFYVTTKKRSDILLSKLNVQEKKKYEIKKFNGANIKIVSSEIIELSNKLIELKEKIKIITKEEYLKTLQYFYEEYNGLFNNLSYFVALIDVIKCSVICAKKYKYNKPIIKDNNNGKSYFNANEIRHPIIEMINDGINYVKNDLELYHKKCNGILLYGVNGAGKSSLSKAVGCNIVLAQMGFYVPSERFEYYPYKKIFTRINGDDNIFKGMSSFAVEMDELRSILKYSDDRSIVLGDEICKGTEETSALAIVSSSILRFCKNNVNFIMATHFHKLLNIELISNIKNIKFMHLTISYDNINGKIIYGRKLMDGPGSDLYGIEIASYIIEDDQFIENAKKIRNDLLNKTSEILVDKKSNYNNKLYMDECSICGDNGTVYPLDTHHIKEQNTFDNNDIHKDKLSNLVVLCKKHHDEVHYGDLEIIGYKDTITGKELEYKYNNDHNSEISDITEQTIIKKGKKKYNEEQIKIIMSIVEKSKGQIESIKYIRSELQKIGINIGRQTLTSIINGKY